MNTSDLISQKKDYYNRQMPALPPKEEPAPYRANPSEAAREVITNTPTEAPRVSLADMAEKPDPTAPGKTFLQQQQEMYDKITAAQNGVETPEQEAARKKRDALRIGLTTFADGLAALSNLYYTTKGAPNQNIERQLPKLQQDLYKERLERDAKLQRFREWQRQKAEQGERDKRNRDLFNLEQAAKEREAERAYNWNRYKFDAEQAAKGKEAERRAAENAARAKETERHNRAMESIGWTRAKNGGSSKKEQFIDLTGNDGKSKRYTPGTHGDNWITTAYNDMLAMTGGEKSPYRVQKSSGIYGNGSLAPSNQEMYDAISRYNADQWKDSYHTDEYKSNGKQHKSEAKKSPLY